MVKLIMFYPFHRLFTGLPTMDINRLLKKAYEFLPVGISDTEEAYRNSSEMARLDRVLSSRGKDQSRWQTIFSKLNESFDSELYELEQWSGTTHKERAAKFVIRKRGNEAKLVILISYLIPYFIIYERFAYRGFGLNEPMGGMNFEMDNWKQEMAIIEKAITRTIPSYQPFPKQIVDTPIKNVIFDGRGRLDAAPPSNILQNLTLFDFYFTEVYL